MANEFSFTHKFVYAGKTGGGDGFTLPEETVSDDQTGSHYSRQLQAVGTTYEALNVGDVSTNGYLFIYNKDASTGSVVNISLGNATTFIGKIRPRKLPMILFGNPTIYAAASTGSVNVEVIQFDL